MESIEIKPCDQSLKNYKVVNNKGNVIYSTFQKYNKKIEIIDKTHKVIGEISQKRVQFMPSNMPRFVAKTPEFKIEINKDMENFKSVYKLDAPGLQIKDNIFGEEFKIEKDNQTIATVKRKNTDFQIQIQDPDHIKQISFFILNLAQVLIFEKIIK